MIEMEGVAVVTLALRVEERCRVGAERCSRQAPVSCRLVGRVVGCMIDRHTELISTRSEVVVEASVVLKQLASTKPSCR